MSLVTTVNVLRNKRFLPSALRRPVQ